MATHAQPVGHHVSSIGTYLTVFFSLLVLTSMTVMVSYMGLPSTASVVVAMTIAVLKASLVVAFFMHLKYDTRFNVLVFLSALWFLTVFFALTMLDIESRGDVLKITDNFVLRHDRAAATAEAAPGAAPAADAAPAHE